MIDLETSQQDLILLAKLDAALNASAETSGLHKKSGKGTERKRAYTFFTHHGLRICRRFFMHLHNISRTRLLNLQKHLKENGLVPRIKRSGGRQNNKHSLSFNDTQTVVTFIRNYAEAHAVSLPGRIPGFMNFNIRLLPSSTTKKDVHKLYIEAAAGREICYVTFARVWKSLLPYILISKPATDLCWTCQNNNTLILRCALNNNVYYATSTVRQS